MVFTNTWKCFYIPNCIQKVFIENHIIKKKSGYFYMTKIDEQMMTK